MSFGRAWRQILISKERKGKRKRTIDSNIVTLNNATRRTKEHYRQPLVSQGFLKEKEVSDKEKSLKFKRLEGKPTTTRGISISSCFLMLLYGLSVCSYGFWSFGGLGGWLFAQLGRGEGRALYIPGGPSNSVIGDRLLHSFGFLEGAPL